MTAREARWSGLILALALCMFLFWWAQDSWTNYWLLRDAQQGSALVTKELSLRKNTVAYRYVVEQKEYSGRDARNSKDSKRALIGDRTAVYFSASHPWLSRLNMPETALVGLPVIVLVLFLQVFAMITFIKPTSRWAFNWRQKRDQNREQ